MTVLYAKNLGSLQQFYRGLLALRVEHVANDHLLLGSARQQLLIVQIPAPIATAIEIADPPKRRTETPFKPVFDVASIAATRELARSLGGELNPSQDEWRFQGILVCDGRDPEGNVLQFRESRPTK
jgi:hypothetical protein